MSLKYEPASLGSGAHHHAEVDKQPSDHARPQLTEHLLATSALINSEGRSNGLKIRGMERIFIELMTSDGKLKASREGSKCRGHRNLRLSSAPRFTPRANH